MSDATFSIWDALDGQLLLPDDPGYEEARQVWNAFGDPASSPTIWEIRTPATAGSRPTTEPLPKVP